MGIKESAIKSCEARIKHLQNVPPHYHGKRQRMREIELEKVKIAALTPPNEWVRVDEWLPDFDTEQILVTDGERYYISTRNNMVHIADREGIFIPGKSGAGVKNTHWRPLPELPCRPSKETSQ